MENSTDDLFLAMDECGIWNTDLIELRLDHLKEPLTINNLKKNLMKPKALGIPVILTLRPSWEGGLFDASEEKRLEILEQGIELGFDYVDLEFLINKSRRNELIKKAKKLSVKTIISHHNYDHTPEPKTILEDIKDCVNTGGNIAKLVYHNSSYHDALNVLQAGAIAKELNYNFTVLGLGPFGHITRILAPCIGCEIVYCSLPNQKEKTAILGQVDINSLKEIWKIMKGGKCSYNNVEDIGKVKF